MIQRGWRIGRRVTSGYKAATNAKRLVMVQTLNHKEDKEGPCSFLDVFGLCPQHGPLEVVPLLTGESSNAPPPVAGSTSIGSRRRCFVPPHSRDHGALDQLCECRVAGVCHVAEVGRLAS